MTRNFQIGFMALALLALAGCQGRPIWSAAQTKEIDRLNKELAASNVKVKIAFDPKTETIVAREASFLIREYGLNTAYEHDDEAEEQFRDIAHRVVRYDGCQYPQSDSSFSMTANLGFHNDKAEHCSLTVYGETPPPNALRTRVIQRKFVINGQNLLRWQIVIQRPDGRKVSLLFFRGNSEGSEETGPLIAAALGLAPRNSQFVNVPGPDEVDGLIAASIGRADTENLALLDQIVKTGKLPPDNDFGVTRISPAEIASRADALVSQFETTASTANWASSWHLFGKLLVKLPAKEWAVYRQRIFAALMVAPQGELDEQVKLVLRMGDLGKDAVPLLMRMMNDGYIQDSIVLTACRVGQPAGSQLRDKFLAQWKGYNSPSLQGHYPERAWSLRHQRKKRHWEQCVERGKKNGAPTGIFDRICWDPPTWSKEGERVYIALKRMGYGEEADSMVSYPYALRTQKEYKSVGPQSSPQVCGEDGLM